MKTKISMLTIVLLMGGLLMFTSCDSYLDVNQSPNNPTPSQITPNLVLPGALAATAGYEVTLNVMGNLMMFNWGHASGFDYYPTQFKYGYKNGTYGGLFTGPYTGALVQYTHLGSLTKDKYGFYRAIGMIMQAFHYQILVDLYGKIPYRQAETRTKYLTPKYDPGQLVYDSLVVKLNDAIKVIKNTQALPATAVVEKPGDADGVFQGDMNKWGAFANSLLIRLLTRENGVKSQNDINKELNKIYSNGYGFIQEAVTINPGYIDGEGGKQNPYFASYGVDGTGSVTNNNQATCPTLFVVNWVKQTNDNLRFHAIYEYPDLTANPNAAIGVDQGGIDPSDTHANQTTEYVANLKIGGGVIKSGGMGSVIMTEAELQLNLAELALKGFNVHGPAKSHYKKGVEASFVHYDLTKAKADTYMSQNIANVNWSKSTNKLNAIMTQKWLATYALTAAQSWFDYNRTGFPNAQPIGLTNNEVAAPTGWPISFEAGSHIDRPVRLSYPGDEYSTNPQNVISRSSINIFTDKVFWAK